MRNPHNLPESAGQRSVALMKGHAPKQDIIGVIVSSPATGESALPDAYLSAFSGMAGPLFERNVKLAQITCMLKVACTFIEKVGGSLPPHPSPLLATLLATVVLLLLLLSCCARSFSIPLSTCSSQRGAPAVPHHPC